MTKPNNQGGRDRSNPSLVFKNKLNKLEQELQSVSTQLEAMKERKEAVSLNGLKATLNQVNNHLMSLHEIDFKDKDRNHFSEHASQVKDLDAKIKEMWKILKGLRYLTENKSKSRKELFITKDGKQATITVEDILYPQKGATPEFLDKSTLRTAAYSSLFDAINGDLLKKAQSFVISENKGASPDFSKVSRSIDAATQVLKSLNQKLGILIGALEGDTIRKSSILNFIHKVNQNLGTVKGCLSAANREGLEEDVMSSFIQKEKQEYLRQLEILQNLLFEVKKFQTAIERLQFVEAYRLQYEEVDKKDPDKPKSLGEPYLLAMLADLEEMIKCATRVVDFPSSLDTYRGLVIEAQNSFIQDVFIQSQKYITITDKQGNNKKLSVDIITGEIAGSPKAEAIDAVTSIIKACVESNLSPKLKHLKDSQSMDESYVDTVQDIQEQLTAIISVLQYIEETSSFKTENSFDAGTSRITSNEFKGCRVKGFSFVLSEFQKQLDSFGSDQHRIDMIEATYQALYEKKVPNEYPYLMALVAPNKANLVKLGDGDYINFLGDIKAEALKLHNHFVSKVKQSLEEIYEKDTEATEERENPVTEQPKSVSQQAPPKKVAQRPETLRDRRARIAKQWLALLKSGMLTRALVEDIKSYLKWLLALTLILVPKTGFFSGSILIVGSVLFGAIVSSFVLKSILGDWRTWRTIPIESRMALKGK